MNNARWLLLFTVCIAVKQVSAREPTSQDYDVWNAILSQSVQHGDTYVWHVVEPTSVFDRGKTKGTLDFFPEARPVRQMWDSPAAELDMEKFRFAQQRQYERPFPALGTLRLLDETTLNKAAGKVLKPTWLLSPKRIQGADSIYRLSWPAYREDGRAAFLICAVCTRWWGAIIEYRVDKDFLSGKWIEGQSGRSDITRWKNSDVFDDERDPAVLNDCH